MKSTINAILQIKSQYLNLNKSEKKIADYILNNPQKIIYSTISQVADALKVADSTIFRFCKKIGFKGFHALKISLATEFDGEATSYSDKQFLDTDDEATIINKVFQSNISALEDSLQSINSGAFKLAVDILMEAEHIVLYGNGGSGMVAMDGYHKFLRTGIKVSALTDSHMQLMSVAHLTDKDAIIVISHSGSNINMLNLLDIAKENGTKTIGITSFSKSPIDEKVDISLNAISQETEYEFEAFASRIAHLTIVDVLYINIAMRRKQSSDIAIKKMRDAITYTKM